MLARKLLRLGDARAAYAVCARHGIEAAGEPRQEAEFLAGFVALRRLGDPAAAERHFTRVGEDSRSVITRARSAYWQGCAAAAQGQAARARQCYAAAADPRLLWPACFGGAGRAGRPAFGADHRHAAAAAHPGPAAGAGAGELAQLILALADIGEARRARIFLLRLEELAADPAGKALVARLALRIGRPDHCVWVVRRAGATGLMLPAEGWPSPIPRRPKPPRPRWSTPSPGRRAISTRRRSPPPMPAA
ncbi:hypothetical protein ACFQU2_36410 [Siccirubricoccus deserti]